MYMKTRALELIFLAVASAISIYLFRDYIWIRGVDFAHHYALIARLTEFGQRSPSGDPSLGEMQIYPPLSHYMAAIVGRRFGSPLVGMQLVGLTSAVALWAAVAWTFSTLPQSVKRLATGSLIVLLAVNGWIVHLDVFGREIVNHYFYSQIVAQAMAMIAVAITLLLRQRGVRVSVTYMVLVFAMLFIESAHLLPAIELLGFLALLVCLDFLSSRRQRKLSSIAGSVSLMLVAIAAAIIHPAFHAMRMISENNGGLSLSLIPNMTLLVTLAAVVALLSLCLVWRWLRLETEAERQQKLAIEFLGILGVAVAILCFMQVAARAVGQGSEYACRKYAFGLASLLLINLALLPAAFGLGSQRRLSLAPFKKAGWVVDTFSAAALVAVASLSIFPHHKVQSLTGLVSVERELNELNARSVHHQPGLSNYAVGLPGSVPVLDYLFSIGIFKSPRTDNAYDILNGRMLSQPNQMGDIITAAGTKPYDIAACRYPSTDPALSVIDGACFMKSLPRRTACSGWFHVTSNSIIDYSIMKGFSAPAPEGTWTEGENAEFRCEMPAVRSQRPKYVRILAYAFAHPQHPQAIEITLNGVQRKIIRSGNPEEELSVEFPVPAEAAYLTIGFHMPDAISPAALGLSTDSRKLGLFLEQIDFSMNSSFK